MKLRDSRLALPADGHWLTARLQHSPDVQGLVIVIGGDDAHEPPEAPGLLDTLHQHDFASLLLELLSDAEIARDADTPFNIPMLAGRLQAAAEWSRHQPDLKTLPLFIVARGTACGAAVRAASRNPQDFRAIVCLGGRMDLAGARPLATLQAPTRVIVSANSPELAILQRTAEALPTGHDMRLLPADDAPAHAATLTLEWIAHWRHVPPAPNDADE